MLSVDGEAVALVDVDESGVAEVIVVIPDFIAPLRLASLFS